MSKKCLPKGRQRAFHLLLKVSRNEEVLEAPRAGGTVRVGLWYCSWVRTHDGGDDDNGDDDGVAQHGGQNSRRSNFRK